MSTSTFKTMADVKRANRAAGGHWFSPDTLRFFRGRIESELMAGRYFVSSEQFDDGSPRLFTVREVDADGDISTVGDFQEHKTKSSAERAIHRLLGK